MRKKQGACCRKAAHDASNGITGLPPWLIQVTAATFGLDGEWLPAVQAHPAVTSFLQVATLLLGCTLSLLLTVKIGGGRHPWRRQAHQLGLIVLLTAELWSLIVTY